MSADDPTSIKIPQMVHEMQGIRLEYDGWRDCVRGTVVGSHSNQKENRRYRFTCSWEGKHEAEITEFYVDAKSDHPGNWTKGTAPQNRRDIKKDAQSKSARWRKEKLEEQDQLKQRCQAPEAVEIAVQTSRRKKCEAWWIGKAILWEPHRFGRHCRPGWIEVLPIGDAGREIVELIVKNCAGGPYDEEEIAEAAIAGLSLPEIIQKLDR